MKIAIIGMGASGLATAFKAKIRKHQVHCFYTGPGASGLSSGCIDLFPFPDAAERCEPKKAYSAHLHDIPSHPLAKAGVSFDSVTRALMDWSRVLSSAGLDYDFDFDRGFVVPNHLGLLKWSVMAQRSIAKGSLRHVKGRKGVVITIEGNSLVDGDICIRNLKSFLPQSWNFETLSCPLPSSMKVLPGQSFQIARSWDSVALFRDFLLSIRPRIPKGTEFVALPALCGLEEINRNMELASQELGIPCFELVPSVDSVPGMRLFRASKRCLEKLDIAAMESKVDAVVPEGNGVRVDFRMKAPTPSGFSGDVQSLIFDRVVIASGRFIGGGLVMTDRGPIEPLTGADIVSFDHGRMKTWKGQFPSLGHLWSHGFYDSHEALRCGLDMKRTQSQGHIDFVGSILAGYDATSDHTGLATAVTLGSLLGERL